MSARNAFVLLFCILVLSTTYRAQITSGVTRLPIGETLGMAVKSGARHIYAIALKQKQVIQIEVMEKGADVSVELYSQTGVRPLAKVDFGEGYDREMLTFIADRTGTYRVIIRSKERPAGGSYSLTGQVSLSASTADTETIEAEKLLSEGQTLSRESDEEATDKAATKLESALSIWKRLGLEYWECFTEVELGDVYENQDEDDKAMGLYEQALVISRKIGDKNDEGMVLNNIGTLAAPSDALKALEQAALLFRSVGNKKGEALTFHNIGNVYNANSQNQKAIEYFERALALRREIGERKDEAYTLSQMGGLYSVIGKQAKAIEMFNAALPILLEVKDRSGQAYTLNFMGRAYDSLGERQKALDYYKRSLALMKLIGDRRGAAGLLHNIGREYGVLEEKRESLDYLGQALVIFREIGDLNAEATTLSGIGRTYYQLGDNKNAMEFYEQALALAKKINDRGVQALTMNYLGVVYDATGDKAKALTYYNDALAMSRLLGHRDNEAATLNNAAKIYSGLGDDQKALRTFIEAIAISREIGDKTIESSALSGLMTLYMAMGKDDFAVSFGKQSVIRQQELRSAIRTLDPATQKTYLLSVSDTYRQLADLLIKDGRLSEAHQILNVFKDQQQYDVYQTDRVPQAAISLSNSEQEFLAQQLRTIAEVGKSDTEISDARLKLNTKQPNGPQSEQIKQFEQDKEKKIGDVMAALGSAEAADLARVDRVPETAEAQDVLRRLKAETGQEPVMIYTLAGDTNFRVLIIGPDKIASASFPIGAAKLDEVTSRFYRQLTQTDKQTGRPKTSAGDIQKTGKELYDIVFAPLAARLIELDLRPEVLMWSLDGSLRYLPVAALYDGRQYLAERYRNIVFTRDNSARMLAPVSPVWTGTGFYNSKAYSLPVRSPVDGKMKLVGFDGLKNARTETETIFGVSPKHGIIAGDLMANERFTKDSLLKALKLNRPLVHIASHFKFEPGDASASFLLLGDGTKLTLEDIKNAPDDLFKGVQLLTLSACETGVQRERESDGREIDGFAEVAQRKGASAVIASLWQVDDESTSQLMTSFYRTRQSEKLTKVEALQKAQLSLLRGKLFSHPYYWAPFILIGNWR